MSTNLKEAFKKFDCGDTLSNKEVVDMIKMIETGILFLESRGTDHSVLFKARLDREKLYSYAWARRLSIVNAE